MELVEKLQKNNWKVSLVSFSNILKEKKTFPENLQEKVDPNMELQMDTLTKSNNERDWNSNLTSTKDGTESVTYWGASDGLKWTTTQILYNYRTRLNFR